MSIQVLGLDECPSITSQGFQRTYIFNASDTNNNIALEQVLLPKGEESVPHAHVNTHTVIYTIKGSVTIYYGKKLEKMTTAGPKESVYIPPNVIHHVVNYHEEEMIAIVARTTSKNKVKEFPELLNLIPSLTKSICYD